MKYSGYSSCDLANGSGARVSLFVSGCEIHCHNCFSPSTWDRNNGLPFDDKAKERLFNDLSNSYIDGLSLLGGDPLEAYNVDEVTELCKEVKKRFPNKTIWLWTGRTKKHVDHLPIMQYLDVVISEPYVDKLNSNKTRYRGSTNQKIWWAKTGEAYTDETLESEHNQNKQPTIKPI